MTNQEIQEKYGIEPIMKEMWVWDENKPDAKIAFVIYKCNAETLYPYSAFDSLLDLINYTNASETNPNEKEPKVGDKGYFWDDEESYTYGNLINFTTDFFQCNVKVWFKHFSHEKQPWMK